MQVKDLTPFEKNPRKITASQKRILYKALQEFGDLGGIVFNRRNQRLVSGHQRVSWFDESTPVTIIDTFQEPLKDGTTAIGFIEKDGSKFLYREVDLDEDNFKAALLAANKAGGTWDMPILKDIILDLDSSSFDIELTAFDNIEIENIVTAFKSYEPIQPNTLADVENNVAKEYQGMPEYEHVDDRPFKSILIKFENEMVYNDFAAKLGLEVTSDTKTCWYPQRETRSFKNLAYESVSSNEKT